MQNVIYSSFKSIFRSPDGLCLLSNSDDNILRIFNLPSSVHHQITPSSQTNEEMVCGLLFSHFFAKSYTVSPKILNIT